MKQYIIPFGELTRNDVALVGGKNASLGEMFNVLGPRGIRVPDGFATTADAFRDFLRENKLEKPLQDILSELDTHQFANLHSVGTAARELLAKAALPQQLQREISAAYDTLCRELG